MPIASVRDSSDEDDTAELAHLPASQRAIELERRQQRRKRFKKQDDQRLKLASKSQLDIAKTRSAFLAAGQQGNPEIIDWDKDTIVGTSSQLEKSYLRLTSVIFAYLGSRPSNCASFAYYEEDARTAKE